MTTNNPAETLPTPAETLAKLEQYQRDTLGTLAPLDRAATEVYLSTASDELRGTLEADGFVEYDTTQVPPEPILTERTIEFLKFANVEYEQNRTS